MINSFGPGNQKIPAKPGNKKGVKKNINPVATNTPVGGTPAANPMGGAQMDFDMPDMSGMGGMQMNTPEMDFGMGDMGGMQMNAPSPVVGNYEDFMMGMTAINGEQPSGFQGKLNPGVLEGPSTAGGGIAGMNSMGVQSPQGFGWDDPAMGGFQMDTPMMNDPMMGQPDMGGMQMDTPMMNDPMMGQFAQPPQVQAPLSPQADLPVAPVAPVVDSLPPVSQLAPPVSQAPVISRPPVSEVAPVVEPAVEMPVAPTVSEVPSGFPARGSQASDDPSKMVNRKIWPADLPVSRPPTGQPDWKGDDTPEPGIDPRLVNQPEIAGGPAGSLMDSDLLDKYRAENPGQPDPILSGKGPTVEEFKDTEIAGGPTGAKLHVPTRESITQEMQQEMGTHRYNGETGEWERKSEEEIATLHAKNPEWRARQEKFYKQQLADLDKKPTAEDKPALEEFKDKVDAGEVGDEGPAGFTGPVSEGAMQNEKNWDTVDGEYKFMGADYHKQNTRPEADTKDWKKTRKEAAKDIKEGDKFSEVGDAAYGTASSASRSAANEAEAPEGDRIYDSAPLSPGGLAAKGGTAPLVSLPPTQPQTDAEYYNKLVNPDPFKNPTIPDLPKGYGSQRVEGGGEYYEFPGREYDVKPEEIFDEYGEPLMGSQGIDSNAGGLTVADVRRRGTSPAQIQALVNNAVAQSYGNYNQGVGGTAVSAGQGMDADMGTYAQQKIAPLVAQRMASGQAQVDIPWQYAMQHADSVRQRRDLAHKLGLEEAGMITGDYYDYLGDRMATADIDNQIMRQMYGEMPDAFG